MTYNSKAIGTQGFKFEIGSSDSPPTFTEVKEVTTFKGFDGTAATVDVTHLQSPAKESIPGLPDFGSYSVDVNYLPTDPGQQACRAAKDTQTKVPIKTTYKNGTIKQFMAYVLSAPESGGVDAKIDASFTLQVTGAVATTNPA